MAERSKAAASSRSQAVLLAGYAARIALGVALASVLGRALSPDSFGFFILVATVYLLAQSVLDLGSGGLAVREIVRDPSRERPLLEGLMAWRQAVGSALSVVVLAFSIHEPDPSRSMVLAGTAASLLLVAPGALAPAFHVRQAQGGPALVGVLGQVLVLSGAVAFHAWGVNGPGFAWLLVVREASSLAVTWVLAVRMLGYRPRPGLRGRGLGGFLSPALVYGGAVVAHELYFYADVFLVRLLRGEAELGAYGAALRPLNPLLILPSILMIPLLPVFTAFASEGGARYWTRVGRTAWILGGIGALGGAVGIGLAPELIRILYGGRYLQGDLQSVAAFRWLCLALAAAFAAAPFTTALLAAGRERALLALGVMGLVANVGGNLLFLPTYGFNAAAVTTAATETVVGLGAVWAYARRHGPAMEEGRQLY